MSQQQINPKIINNAVSAYLMLFVSAFFLLNKQNPYLDNDFVKSHTRSALIIHLGFFLTYFFFIHLGFLWGIPILWLSLHSVLASIICLFLLWVLLLWAYKAKQWEYFSLWEILHIFNNQKISKTSQNSELLETEKLHFLIAHIPFLGFMKYPSHSDKKYIFDATKLNLLITVFFILFIGFGYINIAQILLLIYTVYVVFVGINIFTTNNIFTLQLDVFPHPEKKYMITLGLFEYLQDYFSWNKVQKLHVYIENKQKQRREDEIVNYQKLKDSPELKWPKFLVYVPFINLIYLFQRNNKLQIHIINGCILTLLTVLLIALLFFTQLSLVFLYLIAIISFYGFGYIVYNPVYKMPYIFIFYSLFEKVLWKTQKFNQDYNVEKELHLKVGNKNK